MKRLMIWEEYLIISRFFVKNFTKKTDEFFCGI